MRNNSLPTCIDAMRDRKQRHVTEHLFATSSYQPSGADGEGEGATGGGRERGRRRLREKAKRENHLSDQRLNASVSRHVDTRSGFIHHNDFPPVEHGSARRHREEDKHRHRRRKGDTETETHSQGDRDARGDTYRDTAETKQDNVRAEAEA